MFDDTYCFLLSQDQRTPAHIAAYNGRVDILRMLHQYGVTFNTKDKVSFMIFPVIMGLQ